MDYFTFMENIDDPEKLFRLSSASVEVDPLPLRMHPSDFTQKIHDDSFWLTVSDTFKSLPFTNKVEKPVAEYSRRLSRVQEHYMDNNSVEHLPYYNPAPYYNSSHGYHPNRYMHNSVHEYYDFYQTNTTYYPYDSWNRKRSNSVNSELSMLENLRDLRTSNRNKLRRTEERRSPRCSEFSASELRDMIMEDVMKHSERERRYRRERKELNRHRDKSVERCRSDSGRSRSVESVGSTDTSYEDNQRPSYPTYDELKKRIMQMENEREKEKEDELVQEAIARRENEKTVKQRWRTESSDSDDF